MFNKDKEGKGVWWLLHNSAAAAKTTNEIEAVLFNISVIKKRFECENCRKNFKKTCKKNNPIEYAKKGLIFEWTIYAHNEVNILQGKKRMSIHEARKLYKKH